MPPAPPPAPLFLPPPPPPETTKYSTEFDSAAPEPTELTVKEPESLKTAIL
jgi:hypothetical protein